jgi:hypothetical protein
VDLESIAAEIRAAASTARANTARIAQTHEILQRVGETLDRLGGGVSSDLASEAAPADGPTGSVATPALRN